MNGLGSFNIQQVLSCFIVLFAVIDVFGSTPIIISLRNEGRHVASGKATLISGSIMLLFLIGGEWVLRLFQVDVKSFAVGGAFILFLLSLEMILDVVIFRNQGPIKSATLVPLVFPLLAGAASFTTLLSLRAEYDMINVLLGLFFNMVWVYVVLVATDKAQRFFTEPLIYIMRKFFGIILLAISVRLFTSNLIPLIRSISAAAN
ncbi:MAG: MarC family protein [Bacteroidaceae bacterium]|nr:MarC family protein [Bacteroidaceae bacterium]